MIAWKKIACCIASIILCPQGLAAFNPPLANSLATLSGGVVFTSDAGTSTTIPIMDSTYTYSRDHSTQVKIAFGVFIGSELHFYPQWAWQVGLAYYRTPATAKGNLIQGADAVSSDQYRFHYDIVSQQVLIENKLLFNWREIYHPYLSIGIGSAFNLVDNYTTNVPPFLTFTPMYGNHTTTSFTYNTGFGMDIDIQCNWRFGLGYRFIDFGQTQTGSGVIDTTKIADSLKQSHLYSNELLAQLTYQF